jgi:hypothetical protein
LSKFRGARHFEFFNRIDPKRALLTEAWRSDTAITGSPLRPVALIDPGCGGQPGTQAAYGK